MDRKAPLIALGGWLAGLACCYLGLMFLWQRGLDDPPEGEEEPDA